MEERYLGHVPNDDLVVPTRVADTHPVPHVLLRTESAGQLGLAIPEPRFPSRRLIPVVPSWEGASSPFLFSRHSQEGAWCSEALLMSGWVTSPQKEPCPPVPALPQGTPTPDGHEGVSLPCEGPVSRLYHELAQPDWTVLHCLQGGGGRGGGWATGPGAPPQAQPAQVLPDLLHKSAVPMHVHTERRCYTCPHTEHHTCAQTHTHRNPRGSHVKERKLLEAGRGPRRPSPRRSDACPSAPRAVCQSARHGLTRNMKKGKVVCKGR